ncbi:MAG: DUF169 domain-containing protein [Planctomycetaceae bacterium]
MIAATGLVELLGLTRQPVAIVFQDSAPDGTPRIDSAAPSSCTYWKLAADGQSFFTAAEDHFGCPIGSYTHGIDLPEAQGKELEGVISTMVELEYLGPGEVPEIPRREDHFGVVVYAPLAGATFDPDVILVTGSVRQMMTLAEAAHAAGVSCQTTMVGRPTCAAIPEVMKTGLSATNLGCIGNRVYTELKDEELYFLFAGPHLEKIADRLTAIVHANETLEEYHRSKLTV